VPEQSSLTGYIMVEQVKSVDFASRRLKFIGKAPQETLFDVLGILDAAVYQNP
jgi:mRNA interferase MazF